MNWVDIIIIIIIVVNLLKGINRGLILSAFGLISFLVAAYITKLYYSVLTQYLINHTALWEKIYDFIYEKVSKVIGGTGFGQSTDMLMKGFKLPESMKRVVAEGLNTQLQDGTMGHSAASYLSEQFTMLFINIISIILLFLAVSLLLAIIIRVMDGIARLPVLRTFNRFGGMVFGLIMGLLITYILFTILTPIISVSPDGFFAKATTNSILGNYFYTHNIIIEFFKGKGFII